MASANVEIDSDVPRLVGNADQDTKDHDFDSRHMRQSLHSIQSEHAQELVVVSHEVAKKIQEESVKKPTTTQQGSPQQGGGPQAGQAGQPRRSLWQRIKSKLTKTRSTDSEAGSTDKHK
jgi:hypothetical protein